eukprot:CAMPEP_0197022096 /NCGR_PEP_ID=MMETSP1384-20130603/3004_1 /TAXON_ID=29189 /ORGANISM="Ammonia sp." /LENGTH=274 /DNA_ID=CAMNT_0042450065 /DNA_START=40 /DNA_END=864 /DNA_ORIENTATION=+
MASDAKQSSEDYGDTRNLQTTLGVIKEAYLFKIPPKASAMGHMADTWPKQAMWVGRLKVLSTATECTLQFENPDNDQVYLKVVLNNDPEKPDTIEPAADSTRYFALNITKPGSDQIFELGLGFQTRDESMDFKMAYGEFERMKQNLEEAEKFNMAVKEDFSLAADEVLVMKPMSGKHGDEEKEEKEKADGGGFDGFLPPPSDDKHKKKKAKPKEKKKKKKKKAATTDASNANDDPFNTEDFGDFADFAQADGAADNANNNNDGGGGDDGWATFD